MIKKVTFEIGEGKDKAAGSMIHDTCLKSNTAIHPYRIEVTSVTIDNVTYNKGYNHNELSGKLFADSLGLFNEGSTITIELQYISCTCKS